MTHSHESKLGLISKLFGRYEALVNPLERLGIARNKRVARKAAAAD